MKPRSGILMAVSIVILMLSGAVVGVVSSSDESDSAAYDAGGLQPDSVTISSNEKWYFNFQGNGMTTSIKLTSANVPSGWQVGGKGEFDNGYISNNNGSANSPGTYNCSATYDVYHGTTGNKESTETVTWMVTVKSNVQYTVHFSSAYPISGGSPNSKTVVPNSSITLPSMETTIEGASFSGWYTSGTGGTRVGGIGSSYTVTSNISLYAQYTFSPVSVSLIYDANGGKGAPSPTTGTYTYPGQAALTVSSVVPTKSGFIFAGWDDSGVSGVNIVTAGAVINTTKNVNLSAEWSEAPKTYTVSFDSNDGSGTISPQTVVSGLTITLPTSGFIREGYYLSGWIDEGASPSKRYDSGSEFTMLSRNVTLKAEWTAMPSGLDPSAPKTGEIGKQYRYSPDTGDSWRLYKEMLWSGTYTLNIVQKPSWMNVDHSTFPTIVFSGTPDKAGTYTVKVQLSGQSPGIVSNSVKSWVITVPDTGADSYTLSYNVNGGSIADANALGSQSVSPNNALVLSSGGCIMPGYTLAGWWVSVDGTQVIYPLGSTITMRGDTVAVACWRADNHIVIFDLDGGTSSGISPFIASTDEIISLPSEGAFKTGYTLAGWYSGDSSAIYSLGYLYTVGGAVKMTAYWIADGTPTSTVTYNANGGTGGFNQSVEPGKKVVLPVYGLSRDGYSMTAWNSASSGTGTVYQPGQKVTINSSVTFYAAWVEDTSDPDNPSSYIVVFSLGGGQGSFPTQTVPAGGKVTLPSEIPIKAGCLFAGWKVLGGPEYDFNLIVSGNLTLVATWTTHFDIEISGTTVTVTLKSHAGSPVTISWGDGEISSGSDSVYAHDYGRNSAGTIIVSSNVAGILVESVRTYSVSESGTPDEPGKTIECHHCGFLNPPGSELCSNCGAPLDENVRGSDVDWKELAIILIAIAAGTVIIAVLMPIGLIPYAVVAAAVLLWRFVL